MQNFKDKMYNYEVTPPTESWDVIVSRLASEKTVNQLTARRINKAFYYVIAVAATVTVIIFSLVFSIDSSNQKSKKGSVSSSNLNHKPANNSPENLFNTDDKITIPKYKSEEPAFSNNKTLKDKSKAINSAVASTTKKYIMITGPQGKPVKISSKAATLIVSSDEQNPSKPVWNDKVNKWKDIMKDKILAPTTASFLDIVGLTQALKEQDTP
jgi:hypothetical protein